MYLTLPWFIALVFFCLAAFFWAAIEIGGLHRRYEQVSYDVDRWRDALNDRLERAEDWVAVFIDDRRGQAGAVPVEIYSQTPNRYKSAAENESPRYNGEGVAITVTHTDDQPDPGTVPTVVPGPTTEPINLPATQPQAAVLLAGLDDGHQRWYEDAMKRINAIAEGAA